MVLDLDKEVLSFNLYLTLSIFGHFEEYGYAVVNDVYSKDIPITINSLFCYDGLKFSAGEERPIHITILISHLDDQHPTGLILYINFTSGGITYRQEIFITASWIKQLPKILNQFYIIIINNQPIIIFYVSKIIKP